MPDLKFPTRRTIAPFSHINKIVCPAYRRFASTESNIDLWIFSVGSISNTAESKCCCVTPFNTLLENKSLLERMRTKGDGGVDQGLM